MIAKLLVLRIYPVQKKYDKPRARGRKPTPICDHLNARGTLCTVGLRHRAEVEEHERGALFTDTMRKGPYRTFRHTHRFEPSAGGTRMTDTIEFTTGLGTLIDRLIGVPILKYTFRKRHEALSQVDWADVL